MCSRQPHPDDKRKSQVALTRRTKARLPAARDALRDVVEEALRGFSAAERATLIALLRRIITNLSEAPK